MSRNRGTGPAGSRGFHVEDLRLREGRSRLSLGSLSIGLDAVPQDTL